MRIYHIRKPFYKDTEFRPTIINALSSISNYKKCHSADNVDVYIASGFFDDVSQINSFGKNLQQAISGIDNLYLIGAYNGKRGEQKLGLQLKSAKNLSMYYKCRFHAKIFIITLNGNPIFEIIGSSNMTNTAYGGISGKKYSPNFECDLVIFDETIIPISVDISPYVMEFNYYQENNNDITIEDRMRDILKVLQDVMTDSKAQLI